MAAKEVKWKLVRENKSLKAFEDEEKDEQKKSEPVLDENANATMLKEQTANDRSLNT